ncbi:MAG: type III secretion inner membrane ring lipoprotein SctJ [Deltaproteobacteria bacterium]|jgi:type III secretion protein J|nr:type III secretion inner membrane ring lipoprotein SctJ [Deltaproteobacteria bacterium]
MKIKGRVIILLLFCLLLSGCKATLYQDLTEASANEMLSALLVHGIAAEKINNGKTGFAIAVDERDQLPALNVLRDLGLPKPHYDSLGSVFRKEGMMSSQTEERARLSYALAQELASSCARLDGVVEARVHVVLSEKDQITGKTTPASAAIMLRYVPDMPINMYVPQIQKMVVQSIPDVETDRVSVLLFPVQGDFTRPAPLASTSIFGIKILNGEEKPLMVFALLLSFGSILAGAALAYFLCRFRQKKG